MSMNPLLIRLCLAAVAAAALCGSPAAEAAKLKQQNLTRLIADAEQIVAGKVTHVADGVSERGLPYTEITIAVADSARGELRGGKKYTFRQFGLLTCNECTGPPRAADVTLGGCASAGMAHERRGRGRHDPWPQSGAS